MDNPPDFLLDVWNYQVGDPTPTSALRTIEQYDLFTQVQSLTAIYLFIIPQIHLLYGLFRYCTVQTMATLCLIYSIQPFLFLIKFHGKVILCNTVITIDSI